MRLFANTTVTFLSTTLIYTPLPIFDNTKSPPLTIIPISGIKPTITTFTSTVESTFVPASFLSCSLRDYNVSYCGFKRLIWAPCIAGIETATILHLPSALYETCQQDWPTNANITVGGVNCGNHRDLGEGSNMTTTVADNEVSTTAFTSVASGKE